VNVGAHGTASRYSVGCSKFLSVLMAGWKNILNQKGVYQCPHICKCCV
jgi:hypothetical protein